MTKKMGSYVFVIFVLLMIFVITIPNDAGNMVVEKTTPEKMMEWFSNNDVIPWRLMN